MSAFTTLSVHWSGCKEKTRVSTCWDLAPRNRRVPDSTGQLTLYTFILTALALVTQLRVAASWLNDLVANSDHHSLGAGHCTKLSTKMLHVFFDCSAADVKRLADIPR